MKRLVSAFSLCAFSSVIYAAEEVKPIPSHSSGLLQIFIGLVIVFCLMMGAAWVLKRFATPKMHSGAHIKVIGGVAVGAKERVMIVEVADEWIVVGVASGQVNTLSTMPKQETLSAETQAQSMTPPFATWLKKFTDKRDAS